MTPLVSYPFNVTSPRGQNPVLRMLFGGDPCARAANRPLYSRKELPNSRFAVNDHPFDTRQAVLLLAHGAPERMEDIEDYLRCIRNGRSATAMPPSAAVPRCLPAPGVKPTPSKKS